MTGNTTTIKSLLKMKTMLRTVLFAVIVMMTAVTMQAQPKFTNPKDFFGFTPGDDRQLMDYEQLIEYLTKLDAESSRLKLEKIGESPMGKPMYIAFLSDESNIENLESLRQINHKLALDPDLTDKERSELSKEGRVFVYATLSMHSGEVAPSQSAPLVAYDLASTMDPEKLQWMKDVVYMMVPCHNPDGMDMVVHNYLKYKGTKYEGASLPGVYHKYVGHDNNRDFVILSQDDSRAIAKVYNQTWLPQVMVEKHQMGSTGTRYFVPPNHDPIAENIDGGLWTWVGIFGQNMQNDMTNAGLAGVSQHYAFDNYWPGSTETCLWNNVIAFLTEAASVKDATAVYVEPNELSVRGKGLSEYKKSINMPLPWEGGWWRLGDIVEYELVSTMSIIKTASLYKEKILLFRNDMCRREIEKGKNQAPYYYIIPEKQHDISELINLVNLLRRHGLQVYRLDKDVLLDNRLYLKGDFIVPLAQAYRAMAKEILEAQEYPERHYTPGGDLIKPYDITSWSLPLHRQVESVEVNKKYPVLEESLTVLTEDLDYSIEAPANFYAAVYTVNYNESFMAAFAAMNNGMEVHRLNEDIEIDGQVLPQGSFVVFNSKKTSSGWTKINEKILFPPVYMAEKIELKSTLVKMPRIALVETWFHDMDAGWTRYILDHYAIPFSLLHPADLAEAELDSYDVILFADDGKSQLMTGKYGSEGNYSMSSYAPEYVKGMGKKGLENILKYVNEGGVVLSWGRSTELFTGMLNIGSGDEKEEFQFPVRDISSSLSKKGLNVSGSLLRINVLQGHPLTYGLPEQIGVFSRGRPVFQTSLPRFDMDRRVIATYPEKDILLSGYIAKPEFLSDRSAMVWLKKAKGQVVLYGFNPQFRASTQASFKLLFNGLFLGSTK